MSYKENASSAWLVVLSIIITCILTVLTIVFFLFFCPAGLIFLLIGYWIGKKRRK
jgi:hypothetical protein